jgi:TPP-dependent pyruvate/acetoin dehydrogenase alpha subunit
MGTRLTLAQAVTDLTARAAGYGMQAEVVDGMDVFAVETASKRAVDAIRGGAGPFFLECKTYRFRAHSMYDPELYRSKAEVEEWKKRDPIAQVTVTDAERAQIEHEVAAEIEDAVAFAERGTLEAVEELTRFVYSQRRPA